MSTHDPTDSMWAQACALIDEAERMHRQFFRLCVSEHMRSVWEPPMDVFEDERELVIVVALPGVPADRIAVTTEPGALVVRAESVFPFGGSQHTVRRLEIPYGCFERRIPVPAAGLEAGTRESANGCLIVRLRKIGPTGKP